MKRWIILILCCAAAGCETAPVAPVQSQEVMQTRFLSLTPLHVGMTRPEVVTILGKEVITGYALINEAADQYKPITVANPLRSETIKSKNKTYSIDYYFVGIKVADDKISDDETVPLVFLNDRLAGIGWDFLNKHVKGP